MQAKVTTRVAFACSLLFVMTKKCPRCNKPVPWPENPYRPFCSERCQLIDFGHWADEDYRVPAHDERPSAEEVGQQRAGTDDDEAD